MKQVVHVRMAPGSPPVLDVVQGPGGTGCLSLLRQLAQHMGVPDDPVIKPEGFETLEETTEDVSHVSS